MLSPSQCNQLQLLRRMRPSQIGSREDRARRPCTSPAALQGLTGIVIPSRKTQARRSGQLCSIRGKNGGARSEAKPYRRFQQTAGQSTSGLALRVALGFALFFSSPWYVYGWSWQPSNGSRGQSADGLCAIYCGSLMSKIQHIVVGTFLKDRYSLVTIYEPMCFSGGRSRKICRKGRRACTGCRSQSQTTRTRCA